MNNFLFLFDVDGTIAESSKKIEDNILKLLIANKKENYQYGVISGGKYTKLKNQIGEKYIINDDPLFDYIFCENGMIGYHNNKLIFEKKLTDIYNSSKIDEIILFVRSKLSSIISDNDYPKFEIRNSLIYFSPIGINSNDDTRNIFIEKDNKLKIRENIIDILKNDLLEKFNMKICLGGNIGLSINPINWDKSYIIRNRIIDFSKYNKVFFFGDRCHSNGNDYEIYSHPLTTGFHVNSPEETFRILKKLILGNNFTF